MNYPIKFYVRKKHVIAMLFIGLMSFTIFSFLIFSKEGFAKFVWFLCLVLVATPCFYSVILINKPVIILTYQGIIFNTVFKKTFFSWEDIFSISSYFPTNEQGEILYGVLVITTTDYKEKRWRIPYGKWENNDNVSPKKMYDLIRRAFNQLCPNANKRLSTWASTQTTKDVLFKQKVRLWFMYFFFIIYLALMLLEFLAIIIPIFYD